MHRLKQSAKIVKLLEEAGLCELYAKTEDISSVRVSFDLNGICDIIYSLTEAIS